MPLFARIQGYKRVINCAVCGKRIFVQKERDRYCKDCKRRRN